MLTVSKRVTRTFISFSHGYWAQLDKHFGASTFGRRIFRGI